MELYLLQIMPQNAGAVHMSAHQGLRQSILSCACMQHSYLQTDCCTRIQSKFQNKWSIFFTHFMPRPEK